MVAEVKGNQKRQFRGRKTRVEPRIEEPKDQSFVGGISLTFDHYVDDVATGARTKKVERKTVRFPNGHDLSTYYEQNRRKDNRPAKRNANDKSRTQSVVS